MATKSAETKQFWRKTIKRRAVKAFGEKCIYCNQSFPDVVYDFHHINPEEKEIQISNNKISSKSNWNIIRDELKKCVLICSNCHRIVHSENIQFEKKDYFDMNYYEWNELEDLIDHTTGKKVSKFCKEDFVCSKCGEIKSKPGKNFCKKCTDLQQRTVERPSRNKLKNLIRKETFVSIGKQFGVSDNSIKKWCDYYNLPRTKKEIQNISNEEWENI